MTFTFFKNRQQKALLRPVQDKRLKLLLKCPLPGVIEVVKEMVGGLFQNSSHHWKINVDIAVIVMAWGLEIACLVEEVEWVMKILFLEDLIVGIDSLLEWPWPGKGFDYRECYENIEEGRKLGRVIFLWNRGGQRCL